MEEGQAEGARESRESHEWGGLDSCVSRDSWALFIWVLIGVLSSFVGAVLSEDRPAALPPVQHWMIIAECQMVVLPQKAALALVPDLGDETKIEVAFANLQQMVGRGEAKLMANLLLRGAAGRRLVAESFEEFRYPTQFEPPMLPTDVPKGKAREILKFWPVVGITPMASETRNIGVSLELVSAVSDDGQWISADLTPQHVRFIGFTKLDGGVLPTGERMGVDQPQISALKDVASVQVRTGQRLLVGIHKVPTGENLMELFILCLRTQRTGVVR